MITLELPSNVTALYTANSTFSSTDGPFTRLSASIQAKTTHDPPRVTPLLQFNSSSRVIHSAKEVEPVRSDLPRPDQLQSQRDDQAQGHSREETPPPQIHEFVFSRVQFKHATANHPASKQRAGVLSSTLGPTMSETERSSSHSAPTATQASMTTHVRLEIVLEAEQLENRDIPVVAVSSNDSYYPTTSSNQAALRQSASRSGLNRHSAASTSASTRSSVATCSTSRPTVTPVRKVVRLGSWQSELLVVRGRSPTKFATALSGATKRKISNRAKTAGGRTRSHQALSVSRHRPQARSGPSATMEDQDDSQDYADEEPGYDVHCVPRAEPVCTRARGRRRIEDLSGDTSLGPQTAAGPALSLSMPPHDFHPFDSSPSASLEPIPEDFWG